MRNLSFLFVLKFFVHYGDEKNLKFYGILNFVFRNANCRDDAPREVQGEVEVRGRRRQLHPGVDLDTRDL